MVRALDASVAFAPGSGPQPQPLLVDAFWTDCYVLPLPPDHRFPMEKYRLVREAVQAQYDGRIALQLPPSATDQELMLVHDGDYLQRVVYGTLSAREVQRIGFPWSPEMLERSRRSAGATIEGARSALRDGCAINLAGGTHHASATEGRGYCVFNDAAVAIRVAQREDRIARAAVIDADVHQGDGTATIFARDDSVFTFSIHAGANYPFTKAISDLDIALPNGTGDDAYLAALRDGIDQTLDRGRPDLVIYLAGADPFEGDRIGKLSLTKGGLRERDRLVFEACHRAGIPVVAAMAGGYAPNVMDIVDIHVGTVEIALAVHGR